jgi:hypothetical protein
MTDYRKVTAVLIAAWFVTVLTASAFHIFTTPAGQPPLPLGLAVLIPIAGFWLWFRSSERFRQFALSLNPRTLTMVQSWRIVGFVFLVLYSYGILPGLFALPAGWGDIVIGASAPLAALALAHPQRPVPALSSGKRLASSISCSQSSSAPPIRSSTHWEFQPAP